MDFKKHALLLAMIEALKANSSWTGKTHVQKAMFLLSEATSVTPDFEFVLYKHGPYSFEIESELEQMKSYAAISLTPIAGYGVAMQPDENAAFVKKHAALSLEELESIAKIGRFIGSKPVAELEREATAAWVRNREGITDPQAVAERIHNLKPHISAVEAAEADAILTSHLTLTEKHAIGHAGKIAAAF